MNAYDMYRRQVVNTMTQGEMLIKLYNETLRQIDIAKTAINDKDIQTMDVALKKAGKIVQYFRSVLDHRFPVSKNLAKLYDYFYSQMVMASIKKDEKYLDDITPLIEELKDTFYECDRLDRAGRVATVSSSNSV
jgi:flagellar protein FliS